MTEEELKAVPIIKEIELSRKELLDICTELNIGVVDYISEVWNGKDGQLFAEQFEEVFNIALKIRDYYDELEQYWKSYPKKKNNR